VAQVVRSYFLHAFPPASLSGKKWERCPSESSPNNESNILVIEPRGDFARRVKVRCGQLSGPLYPGNPWTLPGDRVIVTDMSKWKSAERIRLQ
jgi:hypothetical protein